MWLTDLADVLRDAGLSVTEVDGWRTRGYDGDGDGDPGDDLRSVECIAIHHTATSWAAAGDYPTLRTVRDGRPDVAGPLAQLGLGRSGRWYVIAAGRANHTGATHQAWQHNAHALGVEAEAAGTGDPRDWPAAQMDSYVRGVAALAQHYGVPTERVLGHKEIAAPTGRKTDPSFDMAAFRTRLHNPTPAGGFMADLTEQEKKKFLDEVAQTRKLAGEIRTMASETRKKVARLEGDERTRHQADLKRHQALAKVVAALDSGIDPDAVVAEVRAALKGVEITLTTKET